MCRFEQSIAEAAKISKIRDELDKLDQELAVDVEILRKEIEAVSLQYTNTKYAPLWHFQIAFNNAESLLNSCLL